MNSVTSRREALVLLRKSLGRSNIDFREQQWETIDKIVNYQKRILCVQRTGWGKSWVYFLATRILRDRGKGPTLIVSPLLALMRNQIDAAERLRLDAVSINSTNNKEWPILKCSILKNQVDLVLISPERLANDEFVNDVLLPIAKNLGLLVVDEAHCISDWGHDFRPDYRRLVNVLNFMPPNMPVLGTTATANNRVLNDISLQLGNIEIQRGPLARETLALQTLVLPDQAARLAWLAEHVPNLPGSGIIYTLTKRDAIQVEGWLTRHNIDVRAYYSGVSGEGFENSNDYREYLEDLLLGNQVKALVATTALGMGYDKPDLGFVIHFQAPGSVVSYYQQVGRAGRAIEKAICVLLSGREDGNVHRYFRETAFPRKTDINSILHALEDSNGLSTRDLEHIVNLSQFQIEKALSFLSVENPAPLIKYGGLWKRTPVVYAMDHERIERLQQQRVQEWEEVQDYIATKKCLMMYLNTVLDDEHAVPCGKCANCLGGPVVAESYRLKFGAQAKFYLKSEDLPLKCKKQVDPGSFPVYGFSGYIPKTLRAETGRVLTRWAGVGWGRLVKEDEQKNHFRDELVDAVVEMILDRWRPWPMPEWVTCVPSIGKSKAIVDYAERLAKRFKIPFLPAVKKVRANEPQELQRNRFHLCRNLDGAFQTDKKISSRPLLLMDDFINSAWTMTVISALLRQAGTGPVWPVALATKNFWV